MSSAKPGSNIVLGAGFTIAASLAVALMAAIIKWSSVAVSTELLMNLRWATGLLIFLCYWCFFALV